MKICTYNLENFYLLLDKRYSKEDFKKITDEDLQKMNTSLYNPNKSLEKLKKISEVIKEINADFFGLIEVGGRETLNNFNYHYLDNKYETYLDETNSKRGIFVGAIVKKGVFSKIETYNHGPDIRASRNVCEFKLYKDGILNSIVIIVHLKSHNGHDDGIDKRYEEVKGLVRIYNNLKDQHNCPILIMGDFNGLAGRDDRQFEFDGIYYETDLTDVQDTLEKEDKFTHFGFNQNKKIKNTQLDYIFLSKNFNDIIDSSSGVYVYKDDTGIPYTPLSYDDRRNFCPSDHLPLYIKLNL